MHTISSIQTDIGKMPTDLMFDTYVSFDLYALMA